MLSITDLTSVTDSESEMPVKDFILLVVYLHSVYPSPFCLGEGWTSYQIFKKGGGLYRTSTFRGGWLFSGVGFQHLHKRQDKILLKDKMWLRMKNFNIFGVHWKIQPFRGSWKTNIEGAGTLSKKGGLDSLQI